MKSSSQNYENEQPFGVDLNTNATIAFTRENVARLSTRRTHRFHLRFWARKLGTGFIFKKILKMLFQVKKCFDENGRYRRNNINMPRTLPIRRDGHEHFALDTPLTEMGYLQAKISGRSVN